MLEFIQAVISLILILIFSALFYTLVIFGLFQEIYNLFLENDYRNDKYLYKNDLEELELEHLGFKNAIIIIIAMIIIFVIINLILPKGM